MSDNESWMDRGYGGATGMATEWLAFKRRCPKARMVCIDLQPHATVQAKTSADTLNIGGFNDAVWDVIADFVNGLGGEALLKRINEVGI